MSDEIIYVLDVDCGRGITTTAAIVVHGNTRATLATGCDWEAREVALEALKDAITAHGMPDVVVMDASPAADTVAEYCLRMGIRVRRGTSMSVIERALHRFTEARP